MARTAVMLVAFISLISGAAMLAPRVAIAQQMQTQPHDDMMMQRAKLDGTITWIRYVSCGDTPQSCQGIIQVAPASGGEMSGGGSMMHTPGQTALMAHGSSVPLTRLRVGDHITCTYVTQGDLNVATAVMLADMGHM